MECREDCASVRLGARRGAPRDRQRPFFLFFAFVTRPAGVPAAPTHPTPPRARHAMASLSAPVPAARLAASSFAPRSFRRGTRAGAPKPRAPASRDRASVVVRADGERLNVVMVGAECAPFSKTGGLGDVMASLPKVRRDARAPLPRAFPRARPLHRLESTRPPPVSPSSLPRPKRAIAPAQRSSPYRDDVSYTIDFSARAARARARHHPPDDGHPPAVDHSTNVPLLTSRVSPPRLTPPRPSLFYPLARRSFAAAIA